MKTGDRIILILILISLLLGIAINRYAGKTNEKYVEILVDGKLYEKIPLYPELRKTPFMVKSSEGYLYVEISEGKVRVIDSTCRDKLCIKEGWISHIGESIVCLPNRISITIVGGDTYVDSVSY